MSDDGERERLIGNETAKLTATYVNGVAIAVLAVGGLAPIFTQAMPNPGGASASWATPMISLLCLCVSAAYIGQLGAS